MPDQLTATDQPAGGPSPSKPRSRRARRSDSLRSRRRRGVALAGVAAIACGLLSACAGSHDDELIWYINPDAGGQDAVAARCSEGKPYTITTQVLPQDAGQQRIQLARRLAAGDTGIDLMSIDPPYTAEFANAGYLADIPADLQDSLEQQSFDGATEAGTWEDQLVVAPFWSNTQVLWYRKSFVKQFPDLQKKLQNMQGTTWEELIDAAASKGHTFAVQANKYEGYVVWINALIAGAGGDIVSDTDKGVDATIDIDSDAGRDAAAVIQELVDSGAAPPDLTVAQEGQATTAFGFDTGAFLVNWTYTWNNYDAIQPEVKEDLGYAPYPNTVGSPDDTDVTSQGPVGGIGIGVSNYSTKKDWAMDALECLTTPENQAVNAAYTGNMPASEAGYDEVKKGGPQDLPEAQRDALLNYPDDLIQLWIDSLDRAAPRPVTPYYSDVSGSIQSTWHPPTGVDENTPADSAEFMDQVLHGDRLL